MEGSVLVADGLAGVIFGASAEEECRGELDILRALDLPAEEECCGELDILRALDLPAEEECCGELDILRALDLPAEGPESIKMSEAGAGDKVKTAASNGGKAEAGADDEAKAGKKKKKTVRVSKDTINSAMSWPYHGEPRRFLSDELLDRIEDAEYRERLRHCFARAAAAVYDMEEHYKGIREQYIRKGYAEIEVYEREVY